jgi:hypothetical protein
MTTSYTRSPTKTTTRCSECAWVRTYFELRSANPRRCMPAHKRAIWGLRAHLQKAHGRKGVAFVLDHLMQSLRPVMR